MKIVDKNTPLSSETLKEICNSFIRMLGDAGRYEK